MVVFRYRVSRKLKVRSSDFDPFLCAFKEISCLEKASCNIYSGEKNKLLLLILAQREGDVKQEKWRRVKEAGRSL